MKQKEGDWFHVLQPMFLKLAEPLKAILRPLEAACGEITHTCPMPNKIWSKAAVAFGDPVSWKTADFIICSFLYLQKGGGRNGSPMDTEAQPYSNFSKCKKFKFTTVSFEELNFKKSSPIIKGKRR